MCDRPAQCQAIREHNGDYVCNRCGLYWDADDTAPPCKTWDELKQEKADREKKEFDRTHEVGREAIKHLKEILPPPDER